LHGWLFFAKIKIAVETQTFQKFLKPLDACFVSFSQQSSYGIQDQNEN